MGMVIVLAVFAVHAVGGMDAMKTKLRGYRRGAPCAPAASGFGAQLHPRLNSAWMPMITFLVYISMKWWATWYPGAEPGGGGYIAQRMFCAKDEKNSLLATLWFNIAHYAMRPWPWIMVALASLVLFPNLQDPETGYIRVMIAYLPPSLRGLMLAAFAAAYMSTIATQLNWGASYIVNDFYRRFMRPDETDSHYVAASQWATVLLTIISIVVTFYMTSIGDAWKWMLSIGAGTGAVLLLRWYWWRINAWSEISAMISALHRVCGSAGGLRLERRQPRGLRLDHDHHSRRHDGGLADGDVADPARIPGNSGRLLSPHAARAGGWRPLPHSRPTCPLHRPARATWSTGSRLRADLRRAVRSRKAVAERDRAGRRSCWPWAWPRAP